MEENALETISQVLPSGFKRFGSHFHGVGYEIKWLGNHFIRQHGWKKRL